MKQKSIHLGILAFALVQIPYALADDASQTFEQGLKDRREGAKEVVTSPSHTAEDTTEGLEGKHPVMQTTEGAVTGTEKTGEQAIKGTGSIVKGTGEVIEAPIEAIVE
jgi:hypothetical protein